MVTTSFIKNLLAVSTVIVLLTSCALFSRRVKLGEEFHLKPKEKVVVSGAGLEIKLDGVGHQTFPNPQPRPLRSSYVELTVTAGGPPRSITVGDSIDVGDYTITVKSANPFRSGRWTTLYVGSFATIAFPGSSAPIRVQCSLTDLLFPTHNLLSPCP